MKAVTATAVVIVPDDMKNSMLGCSNCLWCGIECKGGAGYIDRDGNEHTSCFNYT